MFSKVWSIGIQKHTKNFQHHVHIRSTDQFNQVGLHEKMTEMISIVWLCICVTIFSSIGKVSGLYYLLTDLCSLNSKFF